MIGIESKSGKWIIVLDRWEGNSPEGHVIERRPGRASIRTVWKIYPRKPPLRGPVTRAALALERDLPEVVRQMIWNLYQEEGTKRAKRPAGWP